LFPSYLLITVASVLGVLACAVWELREFQRRQSLAELTARARLFDACLMPRSVLNDPARVDRLCKTLGERSDTRITVILPGGEVVGDTSHDPDLMENHADREEIREALASGVGWEIRHSNTLNQRMMYVAVCVYDGERRAAVVRTSTPVAGLGDTLQRVLLRVAAGGAAVLLLAAAVSLAVSKWISRPLEDLAEGISRFGRGELTHRLPVPDTEELAVLVETANRMAQDLDARIRDFAEHLRLQRAVFDSMAEAVIAVDGEERILLWNRAAETILGTPAAEALGRFVQEVVRNADLQAFVRTALKSPGATEGDIAWHTGEERYFQARGTALRSPDNAPLGAVVVLTEVTRLHRLELVRRDFVANASHELRTPITSIRGFAETLLDQAGPDPERTRHFLGIILRQAKRLAAIVEDLLTLSRIERQAENREAALAPGPVRDVLNAAIQSCQMQAADKDISVSLECPEDLEASMNAEMLQRAVESLLDNAVKYSPKGTKVTVEAAAADNEVLIHVRDQGCGIAREHLARIFERFYRVDKSRSRELGGTGLGLSIVRHIALAHRGAVTVESAPGQGSTFTLHLPRTI